MDAMMKKLMMLKKDKKKMSPSEKEAKMSVLKDLKSVAEEAMGDDLKGMKKVTVAADSEEGLEEGMDKAKELLKAKMGDMSPADAEHEEEEMEEESEDSEDMSEEELDAKIAKLMEMKKKLKA